MIGELRGVAPDEVAIDQPVQVDFERIDDELTLPVWRVEEPGRAEHRHAGTAVAEARAPPATTTRGSPPSDRESATGCPPGTSR